LTANPIIFGEVLFDCFPDGESVLGGAPFNVAWHLQGFAISPGFLSCVGGDALGDSVKQAMGDWGMDISMLQTSSSKPTGKVNIEFSDGEPHYDICADQAYDYIQASTPATKALAAGCDLFYYGSLAARATYNSESLKKLLGTASSRVTKLMDVNLRPPWWQKESIDELLQFADWVKLNEDELLTLSLDLYRGDEIEARARAFMQHYALIGLIVTQGERGAMILQGEQCVSAATPKVANMVNPVGAGDAFTAVFILGFVSAWPLQDCLHRAQQFAARVCESKAAIIVDKAVYQQFLQQWTK